MSLHQLHLHSLRNFDQLKLTLSPSFTIFHGPNGSGKTTLLEAIYLLVVGYSFKTRETRPLVRYGDPHLSLFTRTVDDQTISIRKFISGGTQVKLNGESCPSNSVLARFLPCQVFYHDVFQIIDAGPSVRRSVMDWGMFHVKHEYHSLWSEYRRVLKQRNALLRQQPNKKEIIPWNTQLVTLATELDTLRRPYVLEWNAHFQFFLSQLSAIECSIEYYPGWRTTDNTLLNILDEQFGSDKQRQYTQSGAHQADIRFHTSAATVKKGLSRGQQKIILMALKLAQGHMLNQPCLYLFDDLTSELDSIHVERLLQCLKKVKGQKVMTVIDPSLIKNTLSPAEHLYVELL